MVIHVLCEEGRVSVEDLLEAKDVSVPLSVDSDIFLVELL